MLKHTVLLSVGDMGANETLFSDFNECQAGCGTGITGHDDGRTVGTSVRWRNAGLGRPVEDFSKRPYTSSTILRQVVLHRFIRIHYHFHLLLLTAVDTPNRQQKLLLEFSR